MFVEQAELVQTLPGLLSVARRKVIRCNQKPDCGKMFILSVASLEKIKFPARFLADSSFPSLRWKPAVWQGWCCSALGSSPSRLAAGPEGREAVEALPTHRRQAGALHPHTSYIPSHQQRRLEEKHLLLQEWAGCTGYKTSQ